METAKLEVKNRKTSRPFYVTLIDIGVLLLIVAPNLIRMIQTLRDWQFLADLLSISPLYLFITGAVWGIGGLFVVVGLWQGRRGMRLAAIWGVFVYIVYYWLDRLFVRSSTVEAINAPFAIAASIIFVGLTALLLTRQPVKRYFGEFNEQ